MSENADGLHFITSICWKTICDDEIATEENDRHVKKVGDGEPVVDISQDYILLLGYENATHTVLRFRRKLDTCDTYHDLPITDPQKVPKSSLRTLKETPM
ncbi:DOMON domain [Sergentomyia squamirostris]